jgi:hypothetical protein
MPEKVRVSPAPTSYLSTGSGRRRRTKGQAALVLVEELDEDDAELLDVDEVVDDVEDEEPESDEPDVDEAESDLAETVLLPSELDRLSVR